MKIKAFLVMLGLLVGMSAAASEPFIVDVPTVKANEFQFKYGIGIELPRTYTAEVKHFSFEYSMRLGELFRHKGAIGLWADAHDDRSSAGYASYSVGVRVEPAFLFLESYWGVSYVTHQDGRISLSFPNFVQDLGVGFRDSKGRTLGFNYKHFSNAGLKSPNRGRDFITIHVGFPLGGVE